MGDLLKDDENQSRTGTRGLPQAILPILKFALPLPLAREASQLSSAIEQWWSKE